MTVETNENKEYASSTSNKNGNNDANTNNNAPGAEMEETYDRLVEKLKPYLEAQCHHPFCQYWIGVAGGPGSGKSTVAKNVAHRLNAIQRDSAVAIGMDGWHIPSDELEEKFGTEGMCRRGAPFTFDVQQMIRDIKQAKKDGEAEFPEYNRKISNPVMGGVHLKRSHKIVFVEGLYVLLKQDEDWKQLYDLWDENWFVECPSREEQINRLIQRSLKTWSPAKVEMWGPGEEGARKRAETNDVPNMKVVEPSREFADEIIVTK